MFSSASGKRENTKEIGEGFYTITSERNAINTETRQVGSALQLVIDQFDPWGRYSGIPAEIWINSI